MIQHFQPFMRSSLILMISFVTSVTIAQPVGTPGNSRARIHYSSMDQLSLLAAQGLEVDHGTHKRGAYVESDFTLAELDVARNMGLLVEVLIEDVQKFYVERNKRGESGMAPMKNATCSSVGDYPIPVNFNHGSMGGFLTYSEVIDEIDDMLLQYPNLITALEPVDTFTTAEGRVLHWVRISDNPNTDEAEPEIFYNANHHAREPAAVHQLIFYMWYLLENYATDPEVQAIVDHSELYFIPIVNPDGYVFNEATDPNGGGYWRKNRRDNGASIYGVDNNRNYDYTDPNLGPVWGTSGISFNTADQTYCGTAAFSEAENQAVKWFVEQHEFKIAFNNHTYGDLLLYPFGYAANTTTMDDAVFQAHSALLVSKNGYSNIISSELYPASGVSDDWMYGETQNHDMIFSYTPEIGYDFWPAEVDIDRICNSTMFMNLTAAHLITNYAIATDREETALAALAGYLSYDLQRFGIDGPGTFTVTVEPVTANLLSVGSPNSHTSMAMLQTDEDSISYVLAPNVQVGDMIQYAIAVDNGLYTQRDTISKVFGQVQVALFDPADDLSNWNSTQTWGTTSMDFFSSPSSITDSPFGNYSDGIVETITLIDPIDLSNALDAHLSFYAKWNIEENFDQVQVQVSPDNGLSWIPQCGNYTSIGSPGQSYGEPVYEGVRTSWVKEQINLSDYLGGTIKVRFEIRTDGFVNRDGFYFDDLAVTVIGSGPNAIQEFDAYGLSISQNMPNPATSSTMINYATYHGVGPLQLHITDQAGRVVHQMTLDPARQMVHVPTGDLAAGVYGYFTSSTRGSSQMKRMVIVK